MYCTHSSVWSVELWARAAAMCCAPSASMWFCRRLYAHVCVRRTIQRMSTAHDARSHTYNRVRGYIQPCISSCRLPNTNTRSCLARIATFIPVHNALCTNAPNSYEQAMYCTHLSVWSVELWASAAAMCCAPSSNNLSLSRLYARVCVREERYSARG
jgi:hypothetical protein